ncbi:N-acetyltransferase ESCO2 [Rhinatrema bivittatum]|uniref:N-acetyltransferase ESCO2 n=1 Tax=Rhinatrema bivittatum TaxID=194408 RepID=UPI00112D47C1|nr:N-acetyltransferase ESCO2 [Rhinatrema bivittatum]
MYLVWSHLCTVLPTCLSSQQQLHPLTDQIQYIYFQFRACVERMAAVTPRKRKYSSLSSDSFSASDVPVKKIMMDFSPPASPLPSRALSSHSLALQAKFRAKSSTAEKDNQLALEADKENLDSALMRELVNSPLLTANAPKAKYRLSPLKKSPKRGSPCKPAVPTGSFYSKGKVYITPLDRKLMNQSKSLGKRNEGEDLPCPSKMEKMLARKSSSKNTHLKNPLSKHHVGSRQVKPLPRNGKKTAPSMLPAKVSHGSQLSNSIAKTQADGPFRVLSLKTKPRSKLLVGAAFFVTGKKLHSMFRKPLQVAKAPSELMATGLHTTSVTNKNMREAVKCTVLPKSFNVPQKECAEVKEGILAAEASEDFTKEKEKICRHEVKIILKRTEKPQLSLAAVSRDQASRLELDMEMLGTRSLHIERNEVEMNDPCTKAAEEKRVSPLDAVIYPMFGSSCTNKRRPQDSQEQLASPPLGSSTPSAIASIGPSLELVHKLNKRKRESKDQLIIDAGQKHFGAVTCRFCGMIYTAASPEDEAQHVQYHQRFLEGIKFVGWKKENIVAKFWDGKIIMIQPDDPKYAIKKADEVRELVDNELGFKQTTLSCPSKTVTYLYVSNEKKIVGCLIAEQIKQAFQVLPETVSHDPQELLDRHRAWRCSTVPQAAICGISRIWVFSLMRRGGIASRMVDTVR